MARSAKRVILAGFRAGASIGALGVAIAGCTPTPKPGEDNSPDYVMCNSAGCGDNVAIVVDKGK